MKNKANFFSLNFIPVLILFCYSCGFNGEIIKRGKCDKITDTYFYTEGSDSQKQYLINISKSKIITFTLKHTITMKGDSKKIYTITHRLYPGQELQLNCSNYYYRNDSSEREKNEYEIVGEVIEK